VVAEGARGRGSKFRSEGLASRLLGLVWEPGRRTGVRLVLMGFNCAVDLAEVADARVVVFA